MTDHFLQSKFINQEELASLLAAAKSGGVSVRWVPVSASLYQCTELNGIQACCDPKVPLDKLSPADCKAAIQKICLELVEEFGATPKVSQSRRDSLRSQVEARLGEKYSIIEEIASGKFSIIYHAERTHSKRAVAVKVFVASELDDWARKAFNEGAERALELVSPAFIKIALPSPHRADQVRPAFGASTRGGVAHHPPAARPRRQPARKPGTVR